MKFSKKDFPKFSIKFSSISHSYVGVLFPDNYGGMISLKKNTKAKYYMKKIRNTETIKSYGLGEGA